MKDDELQERARALARELSLPEDDYWQIIAAALAAVREECAKVVEERSRQYECCKAIAQAIRTGP